MLKNEVLSVIGKGQFVFTKMNLNQALIAVDHVDVCYLNSISVILQWSSV